MSNKATIYIVMLICFIANIGISLPYPLLAPIFLLSNNAINTFAGIDPYILLGISLAVYPLGLIWGSQLLGSMSDRLGRRPVLVWSLAAAAIMNLISAWALIYESFILFILARFINGLLEGNISVARAVITDFSENINKTKALSYVVAAGQSGWFFGPLIGGYTAGESYSIPFYIAATVNFFVFLMVFYFLKETLNSDESKHEKHLNFFSTLSSNKLFLKFLCIQFSISLSMSIFVEFYPVYFVKHWGSSATDLANINLLCSFAIIFSGTIVLKHLIKFYKEENILTTGVILSGIVLLLLTIPNSQIVALVILSILGISVGLYTGTQTSWFSHSFSTLPQGQLMGILVSSFCIANVLVALLGGYLSTFSVDYLIWVGGVLSILSGIAFFLLNNKKGHSTLS